MENDEQQEQEPTSVGQLIRQAFVFQFKLAMDGLRDVLLSPISIVATIAGIVTDPGNPSKYFDRLMKAGHRSDRWINLFNTYSEDDAETADDFVKKAESIVLTELEKSRDQARKSD